jgi:hypothetical protein
VLPTPVGVNRGYSRLSSRASSAPHARGGEPPRPEWWITNLPCSPRPWGGPATSERRVIGWSFVSGGGPPGLGHAVYVPLARLAFVADTCCPVHGHHLTNIWRYEVVSSPSSDCPRSPTYAQGSLAQAYLSRTYAKQGIRL